MSSKQISVILADDHKIMRHGIKSVLEPESEITIVAETSTADGTIEKTLELEPSVLVLDLGLPEKSGIEVILAIREHESRTKIIVLTRHKDENMVLQSMSVGADAYLVKDFSPEELRTCINKVLAGDMILPSDFEHLRDEILKRRAKATKKEFNEELDPLAKLSKREREIFFHLANGMPNRAIAKKLYISPRTVETHRARVIKKLGFSSTADLIRYSIKHNLLTP